MIKELCGKNLGRKLKDPPTLHVVGKLSHLILGKQVPIKYEELGSLVMTFQIQGCNFPNTLVIMGAYTNLPTYNICNVFSITNLKPTSTLLELADRSIVKLKATLEYITISI